MSNLHRLQSDRVVGTWDPKWHFTGRAILQGALFIRLNALDFGKQILSPATLCIKSWLE